MDPNEAWEQLLDAIAESDNRQIIDLTDDLQVWLQKGGCMPKILEEIMTIDQFGKMIRLIYNGAWDD